MYYCKWWTTGTDFHTQHVHSREFYISWSGCMRLQLDWNERDFVIIRTSLFYCVYTYCSIALQVAVTLQLQVHVSTFLFCCYILQSFILVVLKKSRIAFCMIVETINPLLFLKHIAATDFHSKLTTIHEMSWSTINVTNWCISKPLPTTKCYNITCCKVLKPSKALPRKVLNILNNCFHISDKETSNLHLIPHSIWLVTHLSNSWWVCP